MTTGDASNRPDPISGLPYVWLGELTGDIRLPDPLSITDGIRDPVISLRWRFDQVTAQAVHLTHLVAQMTRETWALEGELDLVADGCCEESWEALAASVGQPALEKALRAITDCVDDFFSGGIDLKERARWQ